MKTLKYSLVALLALGTLNCVSAEEAQTENNTAQKVDKSIPPSTKTSLMDALEGTTIGGYAYGQLTSMFGADADGTAFRVRTMMDVNTGAYHGFSIGTRLFASIGGGAPNGKSFLENSGFSPADPMTVEMHALYGRKTFESSASVITAGKINITAPFADQGWDYGYGVAFDNYDVKGIGFHVQGYGAWALDNGNTIDGHAGFSFVKEGKAKEYNDILTSEKGLFIFGISGDRKEFAGFGFDIWAAHAIDTIDFLTFADLNYSIAGVKLQGQIAATQVNTSSKYFNHGGTANDGTKGDLSAKLRGLYNLQVAYNSSQNGLMAAVGYTGSFGDGYGALLNYTSSFNMGGQIWYDTLGSGANGYGLIGSGGVKNSDGKASTIQVIYASLGYKGVSNLSINLDYAWVSGNNNYALMAKGLSNNAKNPALVGGHMNASFHEVSLSAKYAFTDKLSMSVLVGSTFGDLEMGRARARLNYSF